MKLWQRLASSGYVLTPSKKPSSTRSFTGGNDKREPIEVRIERNALFVISYPGPDRSVWLEEFRAGRARPRRYRNRRIGEFLKEQIQRGLYHGIPMSMEARENNGLRPADFGLANITATLGYAPPIHPVTLEVAVSAAGEATSPAGPESRPESRPEWGPESTLHRIMAAIARTSWAARRLRRP